MDAIDVLKTRRSVRSYTKELVPRSVIEDIVDCARLAATARNEQLWEFIVITDAKVRERLGGVATNGPFIAEAPVCIVTVCKEGTYYLEDGSAATQNILLAARAHALGSCWVAGDKKPYAAAVLETIGAPADYKLVSLVAIGHTTATPKPAKRPLSAVIHWEKF